MCVPSPSSSVGLDHSAAQRLPCLPHPVLPSALPPEPSSIHILQAAPTILSPDSQCTSVLESFKGRAGRDVGCQPLHIPSLLASAAQGQEMDFPQISQLILGSSPLPTALILCSSPYPFTHVPTPNLVDCLVIVFTLWHPAPRMVGSCSGIWEKVENAATWWEHVDMGNEWGLLWPSLHTSPPPHHPQLTAQTLQTQRQ